MKVSLLRRVIFAAGLTGFLASVLVHISVISGWDAQAFPINPFVLHFFAILTFGLSLINLFREYMEIPPAHRPPFVFGVVWSRTPKWMLAVLALVLAYAVISFFGAIAEGKPGIRGFSGHWMLFFLAAAVLAFPAAGALADSGSENYESVNSFETPAIPLFKRATKGMAGPALAWQAILFLGFLILAAYFQIAILWVPTVLFLLVFIANAVIRVSAVKHLITKGSVERSTFKCEYLVYDTLKRFELPLNRLKVKLTEFLIRGTSLHRLEVFDENGKLILRQNSNAEWDYRKLKRLADLLQGA
ncbi:MAG: hypothetical protein JNM27_16900 [Leptospirales bacterium]|nr:hypothetical protein [Leptospirales bacterium]